MADVYSTIDLANPGVPTQLDAHGRVMLLTEFGFRYPHQIKGLTVVNTSLGGVPTTINTLISGENQSKNWLGQEAGATDSRTVLPGRLDHLLGSFDSPTDYLKRISCIVSGPLSRVVVKEGLPAPKAQLVTHGVTASTVTTINTAINLAPVFADQYKDHLVRVGTSAYRKILTHPPFAAGVVNSFTLDVALPVAPAVNVQVYIEDPEYVIEWLPNGMPNNVYPISIERFSRGAGWRVSTEANVLVPTNGDFDNV